MVSCDIGETGHGSGRSGDGSLCASSNSAADREAIADPAISFTTGLCGERGRISAVPIEMALLKLGLLMSIVEVGGHVLHAWSGRGSRGMTRCVGVSAGDW